jgi:hypothetical protein
MLAQSVVSQFLGYSTRQRRNHLVSVYMGYFKEIILSESGEHQSSISHYLNDAKTSPY